MQTASRHAQWRKALPAALLGLVAALALSAAGDRAQAAPILSLEVDCTPDTIRPHEEALFTCSTTITNSGDATATEVDLMATLASGLSLPGYRLFDRTFNGEQAYVSSAQISFDFPDIGAGESVHGSMRVIFGVSEQGSYGFQLDLRQGGEAVDSATVSFEATAASPYPPTNLVVTRTLITEPSPPKPLTPPDSLSPPSTIPQQADTAEYELVVKNESDVTMSGVTVLDKYSSVLVVASADPPATDVNETTSIAKWEMGALGPGEEHRVRVIFEATDGCAYTGGTMVVIAQAPSEEESYFAESETNFYIGPDDCPGLGPGQGGGPGLPSTGTGHGRAEPYGDSSGWPAALALTVGGVAAFSLVALRFRRRPA